MTVVRPADVLDAYRDAVDAKDVDAFVALYASDVRIFDLWGRWSYDGVDAWRTMVADWFGSLGAGRVEVAFDDVRTVVGDDVAVIHAFIGYRSIAPDGSSPHAMSNRVTWTLVRAGDTWRIAHEHTSAPVDLATSKVMLAR